MTLELELRQTPEVIYNIYPDASRQSGVRSYAQLLERIVESFNEGQIKLETPKDLDVHTIPYGAKVLIHIGVNEGEMFSFLDSSKKQRPDLKRMILSHDPPFFPLEKRGYLKILRGTRVGRGIRKAINAVVGNWWDWKVVRSKDLWITLSECGRLSLRNHLLSMGIQSPRVECLPLGLYLPGVEFEERQKESLTLGYFGYISPSKGIGHLLNVAQQLKSDPCFSKIKLMIAGSPDSEHSKRVLEGQIEFVRSLGMDSTIKFLPAPSDDELPEFLKSIDLLVLPYLRPGSCSASGPMHWAWTFGVPVMASDSPYFFEKLKGTNSGIVAPLGDVESWSNSIRDYLNDPSKRKEIIINTRRMQIENSWEVVSRRFEMLAGLLD